MTVVVVVICLVLLVLAAVAMWRRRSGDGVATFQRQIDALSPEARRPVVDQVQRVAEDEQRANLDEGTQASEDDPAPDDEAEGR